MIHEVLGNSNTTQKYKTSVGCHYMEFYVLSEPECRPLK